MARSTGSKPKGEAWLLSGLLVGDDGAGADGIGVGVLFGSKIVKET